MRACSEKPETMGEVQRRPVIRTWFPFAQKARNPHVVSDCQPSNPPGPELAGTNTHYPRTRHQRRVNFKLGEGRKAFRGHRGYRTRVRIGCGNYLKTTSPPPRGYDQMIIKSK
ncbi:hypothetical protein Bca4012_086238 [Brassica carinata]